MPFHKGTIRECAHTYCAVTFEAQSHHHRYCCSVHKDAERRLRRSSEGVRDVVVTGPSTGSDGEQQSLAEGVTPLRILFFDIESSTTLAHVFQARNDYISHSNVTHETFMLCWSAKWAGEPGVFGDVLTPDEVREQEDLRIIRTLAEAIRQADVVVAHNADGFDIPKLNTRLMLWQDIPIGPVKTIDTLTLARRSFKLFSNRLDHLAEQLGLGGKLPTGFELWKRCYFGDPEALAEMYEYNQHDVVLLEQVYDAIAPYVKGLPRLVDGNGEDVCPFCGSAELVQQEKDHRTNASSFPMFRCDGCDRFCRGRKAIKSKRVGVVPLG